MAKTLTAVAVSKMKAASDRLEIPDAGAPGLRLVIQPTGHKSWAMRFHRPNGKSAKLTLGSVNVSEAKVTGEPKIGRSLTLAQARKIAGDINAQRDDGIDVIAVIKTDKKRRQVALLDRLSSTFSMAARDFIDDHKVAKTGRKPRRWRDTARLLGLDYDADGSGPTVIKNGLCDIWADKPVADVTADDVYHLIEEARRHGIPGLERRNVGTSDARGRSMADALGTMFKYLSRHRRVATNPCLGGHRPSPPAARDRVLNVKTDVRNADELRFFWRSADLVGEPFGALLKLLLLTGCRLNELARMTWDELSDGMATLRLPGDRTKNGRPHDVPLPPSARDILKVLPKLSGKFVFTTNGKTPISGFSKIKGRLDALMLIAAEKERGKNATLSHWRIHDLRRTAATGMAGIGIQPHIIEAVLNHVSGSKSGVAGTYNREAYEPEKKAALERWANYVSTIVSGREANVLSIRGKRK